MQPQIEYLDVMFVIFNKDEIKKALEQSRQLEHRVRWICIELDSGMQSACQREAMAGYFPWVI